MLSARIFVILIIDVMKQIDNSGKAAYMKLLFRFLRDEEGATAIEYALLTALIAVVAIASMTNVGTAISNTFSNVSTSMR